MTTSTLWPFVEAQKIISSGRIKEDKPVIFETGYGPSGLPHIGTFGEVVRTNWVRKAFRELTGKDTRLIAFSDDMDALRKTPDNIPNKHLIDAAHGLPLSKVPNPFGTEDVSFAHHNNRMLREFLDSFDLEYEFASSSEYYLSGRFNAALQKMAIHHAEIVDTVAPTLGQERRSTWSPFMPIHPLTGKVMMAPILSVNPEEGTIIWKDDNGDELKTSIYDGNCKIQWKADWALRWYALGVDYEMSGKDLIESVKLSSKICRILGGTPPINLTYELFLDEQGQKISKSKGNGMTIDQWLDIATPTALKLYMFNNPTRAKKIGTTIAVQMEEEYIKLNNACYDNISIENYKFLADSAVYHFIGANGSNIGVTYGIILNIVSASSATTVEEIWKYLRKYRPDINEDNVYINSLIKKAMNYYRLYVEPAKRYRSPTAVETAAMEKLLSIYENYTDDQTEERYQYWAFEVGKEFNFNLRSWFQCLYEVLLGQSSGPRFGVFVAGYGRDNVVNLMREKLR